MNRRSVVRSLALLSAWPAVKAAAQYFPQPGMLPIQPQVTTISVNIPQMVAAGARQLCPEWCWATSISMIFGFHGHPIDQTEIVAQTYGVVACVPAGSSSTIAQDLSRQWVDDNGVGFTSRIVAAYDAFNGVFAMNNAIIANELQNNRPLLYCNTHHAMVVCALQVVPTARGPVVAQVDVVDPWPASPGLHPLTPPESVPASAGGQMTFLAAVVVS
jgi:hypothetical protein